jgi:hypothetical protein
MSSALNSRSAADSQSDVLAAVCARYARPVEFVARFRWLLLAPAALLSAANPAPIFGDPIRFARAGAELFGGRLAEIYTDPWMQAGPFELIGSFLMFPFPHQHTAAYVWHLEQNLSALFFVFGALVFSLVMITIKLSRRFLGMQPSPVLELVVGLGVLISALPGRMWPGGHVAQLAIPFFWVAAGVLAARGRTRWAAVLVGLSAGWETWGVLAAGLVVTDRRPRQMVIAAALVGAGAVAPYLPFVLSGHFGMFELEWPIGPNTLVHTLWPDAALFSWWMRMIQGGWSVLAGVMVVLALGRAPDMIWLAPLAIVLVRLLLDPLNLTYYWLPLCTLSLIGVGLRKRSNSLATLGCVFLLAYLPPIQLLSSIAWPDRGMVLLPMLLLVVILVVLLRRDEQRLNREPVLTG